MIDGLIAATADLVASDDPLDAELLGASFVSVCALIDPDFQGTSPIEALIPEFEARANSEALAILLAIGSVADGAIGRGASAAAQRLARAGFPRPSWADELDEPVRSATAGV